MALGGALGYAVLAPPAAPDLPGPVDNAGGGPRVWRAEAATATANVIAPAAQNPEILDAHTLTPQKMQEVLQRGDDVILAWCNSENSRQVMNALGVNVRFAPF